MNRRRTLGAAFAVAGLAWLGWPASPVEADTPVVQTWWTTRNLSLDLPIPTLVPVPPVTVPSQDVPDGGSEVAGTEAQPIGLLTLRYEFPESSTVGDLVLAVADEVAGTPATALRACPLAGDGTFSSEPGGGPIGDAPAYECDRGVDGQLDEDAGTWSFPVQGLDDGDHLAVAVIATTGRVVFERARTESLEVIRPADVPLPPGPRPVTPTPVGPAPMGSRPAVVTPAPIPPAPSAPVAPAEVVAPAAPASIVSFLDYDGAGERVGSTAFGLLGVLALAAAGWRRGRRSLLAITRRD